MNYQRELRQSEWENGKTFWSVGFNEDPYRTLRRWSSKPTLNQYITEWNIGGNWITSRQEIWINFGNHLFSEPNNALNLSRKERLDRTNAYLNETYNEAIPPILDEELKKCHLFIRCN